MVNYLSAFGPPLDAANATNTESWIGLIDEIAADKGYLEPLGKSHWAFFTEARHSLLISFETLDGIRSGHPTQMPLGYRIARDNNWSHLTMVANGATWWRDPKVYAYFDRLVDDGFFEDFDRVVFYGAGSGGYAAAAYSVAAPGASVLIAQPCATLDPAVAGWDDRHRTHRRLNFTDRYGYAPDMVEAADLLYILFDPTDRIDAMHAALFRGPQITHLPCRHLGPDVARQLDAMGLLSGLIEAVLEDRLTRPLFAEIWRNRQLHPGYLMGLIDLNLARGHRARAIRVCRYALAALKDLRFQQRLDAILSQ